MCVALVSFRFLVSFLFSAVLFFFFFASGRLGSVRAASALADFALRTTPSYAARSAPAECFGVRVRQTASAVPPGDCWLLVHISLVLLVPTVRWITHCSGFLLAIRRLVGLGSGVTPLDLRVLALAHVGGCNVPASSVQPDQLSPAVTELDGSSMSRHSRRVPDEVRFVHSCSTCSGTGALRWQP